MRCDVQHELITFASKDCPLCRLRDDALDVVSQIEQLVCELEEIVRPTKKTKKKRSKKAKRSGKLLHFPRIAQPQPEGAA